MSITIYHNPRCSKSRATLALLHEHGHSPEIIEYLKSPPDSSTLRRLANKLGLPLSDMVRTGEQEFKDTNRTAGPLHFVILHLKRHGGWSPDQLRFAEEEGNYEAKRLTCNKFYKYQLQQRPGETNYYLLGGRLFQEYVCLSFAKSEQQKLSFLEMNQAKLRTDLYQNIVDHMRDADVEQNQLGRHVILPATHIGSPRDMHSRFQDAMAIVRRYENPHLFITVTCNPMWKEIQDELLPGQKAEDRPDLVSRLFQLKLKAIEEDLLKTAYLVHELQTWAL